MLNWDAFNEPDEQIAAPPLQTKQELPQPQAIETKHGRLLINCAMSQPDRPPMKLLKKH